MKRFSLIGIAVLLQTALFAQVTSVTAEMPFPVISTGAGRVFKVDTDSTVTKLCKGGNNVHDAWSLENGNILVAGGNEVAEYNSKGKRVFRYKPKNQKGGGVFSCQRLANGNTVVGENSTARVLELDADGNIVFELQTEFKTRDKHHRMRMVRKLANGNYLVCHSGDQRVREYRPDGTVAWEKETGALAFAAVRLENGNTMISTLSHITEYDPAGEVVWQLAADELPVKARNMTGFQLLPDQTLLIGCYDAYSDGGVMGIFQVNREKEVLWYYSNPGGDRAMMGVQMLHPQLSAEKGTVLR